MLTEPNGTDVWALGVLLYKLCYYTTPFEEHGPLAIVNAKYTFPSFPVYSPPLQHLIGKLVLAAPAGSWRTDVKYVG
jgi:AP2-associated kinase